MMTTVPAASVQLVGLSRREIRSFAGRPGARIESRRGRVWITQDGDPRDVVLEAGESHALDRDGPVFVQALDAALVLLPVLPRAQARADRLWRRLARAAFSA
jgi:hypothetical protein